MMRDVLSVLCDLQYMCMSYRVLFIPGLLLS